MKTSAQRMHRHNKHSTQRYVIKAPNNRIRERGLAGENEFIPEPPHTPPERTPRAKAQLELFHPDEWREDRPVKSKSLGRDVFAWDQPE